MICKLKVLQNIDYSLICRSARSDHISPILCDLHWLPVESCVQYLSCVLLPLNHWATKPVHISLISFNSMFLLAKSVRLPILVFHRLISSLLVCLNSSINHHYWGIIPYAARHSSSMASFQSVLKTHLFSSGLRMPCLCGCGCSRVHKTRQVCGWRVGMFALEVM